MESEAATTAPQAALSPAVAAAGFFVPLAILIALVVAGTSIVIAVITAICFSCLFSVWLGHPWSQVQAAATRGVMQIFPAAFMMILVGFMIAVWIEAGSVPTLLYYGIQLINPRIFLPLSFLICLCICLTIGTSWGTAGTVGLALMGVAQGLGIPLPMSAGAIISGALVGEKLSPISGTTILTAASTNTNLIDHIVSMLNTTIPASVVSLALLTYLGWHNAPASSEIQSVATVLAGLHDHFVIHPVLLVPPLFVLALSALRKPAIPVFVGGIALGVVMALMVQRASLVHVLNSGMDGFKSNTGVRIVDALLSRGGVASMSFNLYLCLCAGILAGILDQQGILTTLLHNLLSYTRTIGGLVLSTTVACLALMFGGAGQFCTLTLPGIAFRKFYEDRDVHSCVLSRTMEDCGTMVGAIIPWDVSALYYASVLGVSMYAYAPYAFMAWLPPFVSIACAYIGLGAFRTHQRVRPLVFRG